MQNSNTVVAAAALQKGQFVKLDGSQEATPCTAAGEEAYGVALNSTEAGKRVVIVTEGTAQALCSDNTVKLGDEIMTDADGQVAKATKAGSTYTLGKARYNGRAASSAGQVAFLEIDLSTLARSY